MPVALVAALCFGAVGCADAGGAPPEKDAAKSAHTETPAPPQDPETTQPSEAQQARYDDARAAIRQQQGIAVRMSVSSSTQEILSGEALVSGDLLSWKGDFLADGMPLSIIRIGEIAWIRAPKQYWEALGVPADTAKELGDQRLFATFNGDTAKGLVAFADVTAFLQTLTMTYEINEPEILSSGDDKGKYAVTLDESRHLIAVSQDGDPWIQSVVAAVPGGGARTVELAATKDPVAVAPPAVSEVYQGGVGVELKAAGK